MANPFARFRLLLLPAIALGASTCTDPSQFLPTYQPGGPQGIIGGSVTYSGPLPCTESQHVVGAAVFLGFNVNLLPPPEGLGTTAASLATIGGDALFGSVLDRLTFNTDGSRWCPAAPAPQVTVSGNWTLGPLPGGTFEVRAFYDLHGQFDPVFSITKLPHQGDIAGGAIDNVSAVLTGATPIYRQITLGTPSPAGDGTYVIPPEGSNIEGVAVTLGLPLPLGLPIFYSESVAYSQNACKNGVVTPITPPPTADPRNVVMASDYTLPVFNQADPAGTEQSLLRMTLGAGVFPGDATHPNEIPIAAASPYDLPVQSPAPTISFAWQDVNGDGMLDITHDHVAASSILPALFPVSIFSKLASATDDLTPQASPVVVLQGLTLYQSLLSTVEWALNPPAGNVQTDTKVIVGVTPAVLCLDPADVSPTARAKLVITHLTDCGGNAVLTSPSSTMASLAAQFNRPVDIVEACLPQGRYSMNLVYDSGQAWTVPNEAGVCQALEPESKDGTMCVASGTPGAMRTRLQSQDVVLTIGPPSDPSYCADPMHQTPAECCPSGGCK